MANSINLDRYNPENEDIRAYLDIFELICAAMPDTATDAKKKSLLCSCLGINIYSKLMQAVSPKKPSELSLQEMYAALIELFYTPPSPEFAFNMFFSRVKKKTESVKCFYYDVKRLADDCRFPPEVYDLMIKERLFVGCKEEDYFKLLLNNDFEFLKLKSHEMYEQLISLESMYASQIAESTNVGRSKKKCTHCGKSNHETNVCHFKDAKCYKCNKDGHIAPNCKSKKFHKKNDD